MAKESHGLTLDYSDESLRDLGEIWEWNAGQRGAAHADGYTAFLREQTQKLAASKTPGRAVPGNARYRYATIKRRVRGHGHVAVFEIDGPVLRVLRYFHTAQDWEARIAAGEV